MSPLDLVVPRRNRFGRLGRQRAGRQPVERVVRVQLVIEEAAEFGELLGEVHCRLAVAATEGGGGARQSTGSAAYAEVDAAGSEGSQHVEVLGHLVGAVVLEHNAAGADADSRGVREQVRYQDFGRGAHDAVGAVMLGDPEAMVSPLLGLLCQPDGVAQGVGGGIRFVDGTLVENAELAV